MSAEATPMVAHESSDDVAVRRAYEAEAQQLTKSPPDKSTDAGYQRVDRSTSYVAKKLETAREQLAEHKANTATKHRELQEARKAEARVKAHTHYWRDLVAKDVGR